jgi:hypothetical protein
MDAKKARAITDKSLNKKSQVKSVLKNIEMNAIMGKDYFVLDDDRIILTEEDYKYLERLGYKVFRPVKAYSIEHFPIITW